MHKIIQGLIVISLLAISNISFSDNYLKDRGQSSFEILDTLQNLIQVNIDAYHAYSQCIENLETKSINPKIKEQFFKIREKYKSNIHIISHEINKFGQKSPSFTGDLKGYVLKYHAQVKDLNDIKDILYAMIKNEMVSRDHHVLALNKELPTHLKQFLEKNIQAENEHKHWFEYILMNNQLDT
ncbi:MAG: hypothetical protein JWM09_8 [Francisellaceae bacterium]|nr:hypothetical protein [Francisellaceae bacterium]